MAMTRRTSICLSLLALLSSVTVSLGDASHISGSSLIGVSSVSEILDQFFKKDEMNGRKAPAWKSEAQAMISLVQNLKDIDPTTQAQVDVYVGKIIAMLKNDTADTKSDQVRAADILEGFKNTTVTHLGHLDGQLTKVKSLSGISKTCRANVSTQNSSYFDTHGCTNSYLPSQGGTCPTECGKPSTAEFELNADAKQTYTCDFEAGETAKQCVDRLRAKVNMTRTNLTNKYNAWSAKKTQCEAEMAKCAKCNPLWDTMQLTIASCNQKRQTLYDAYCTLQTEQNDFCESNETLHREWSTDIAPGQRDRWDKYIDTDYITCIFEKYLEQKNFTTTLINSCPKKSPSDFYTYATPPGELTLPNVDASAVPACYGAVSHSSPGPLFDMTGLINELTSENLATTVSVADHLYAPAAGSDSVFCTAVTQ